MIAKLFAGGASWLAGPTAERLGWTLVHFLWQGAAVALVLWLLFFALRGSTAHCRYLLACAGMLLMASCPLITLVCPSPAAPSSSGTPASMSVVDANDLPAIEPSASAATSAPASSILPAGELAGARSVAGNDIPPFRIFNSLQRRMPWLVAAWFVGIALLCFRLCFGWVAVQRMRRHQSRPVAARFQTQLQQIAARLQLTRPVRLLESALVEVPTLIGWFRPVILLPASSLLGLSTSQLAGLLAHELAHVRRHDYAVNLVQTVLETLLFYHPSIWWLSRTLRAERENCCDDIAADVCGSRIEYARALASMEQLRADPSNFALAANGSPLVDRIRRLLGVPAPQANQSAWWVMAIMAAGVSAVFAVSHTNHVKADGPAEKSADQVEAANEGWGSETGGFRCRLVATPPEANDESPDMSQATETFVRGEDVTFGVEVKNVSDKPAILLGVRYGDSFPTAVGKLHAEALGPLLFHFEFTDAAGNPVPRPVRNYQEMMLQLDGASAHEIAPGKSLITLLRPARFQSPMQEVLPPGQYHARVHYRGPTEKIVAEIRKHWPDRQQGKAWTGKVTSNQVAFSVAGDPKKLKPVELIWGEASHGLQAAVEFRQRHVHLPSTSITDAVPLNSVLEVTLHLKNISQLPISFSSENWRQGDGIVVKHGDGEEETLRSTWYSGWPIRVQWTLQPDEEAKIAAAPVGIASDEKAADQFEHPVGAILIAKPGNFTVRYNIRLGDFPASLVNLDWKGELATGQTPLVVRARTNEDNALERTGEFVGHLEFVGKDGQPIKSGTFTTRAGGQRQDTVGQIHSGPIDLPGSSARPLIVTARAPGYEEAVFYDVSVRPDETKRLELAPAAPTRFRLISAVDGKPVAGAQVRFFCKTGDNSSGFPWPVGIHGPVWAVSQPDGMVLLDSLQKTDPLNDKVGDALYFLYIESPGLAGHYVGGIKAGAELGDVRVGPQLEVSGEIHGTPEQLGNFAAEWDQPFVMKTANPAADFAYAVSKRLDIKRDGDKLTFRLTGLRAGKLRLICSFRQHPHSTSYSGERRDPSPNDVVVELDLGKSISDLVITPAGRLQAPARSR